MLKRFKTGNCKFVYKYLGFLSVDYSMSFSFQQFDWHGFLTDTYSFYNSNGCFTLYNIGQIGEWGWYLSRSFGHTLTDLLEKEINQREYLDKDYYCADEKEWLCDLSIVLKQEIAKSNSVFGIKI